MNEADITKLPEVKIVAYSHGYMKGDSISNGDLDDAVAEYFMVDDKVVPGYWATNELKLIWKTSGANVHEAFYYGPDELIAWPAQGCSKENAPSELFLEAKKTLSREEYYKILGIVHDESSGRGHIAVDDKFDADLEIIDATRQHTLFFTGPEYLQHLQQSLRWVSADRGYNLPKSIVNSELFGKTKRILNDAFDIYERSKEAGVITEDARYLLPLATKTNITTKGNAREFKHLKLMAQDKGVPSVVKSTVDSMIGELKKVAPITFKERVGSNKLVGYRPSSQLFAEENKTMEYLIEKYDSPKEPILLDTFGLSEIDGDTIYKFIKEGNEAEGSNLKSAGFVFLNPTSLSSFHQATRHRTLEHSVETVHHGIERNQHYIPLSVKNSSISKEYVQHIDDMVNLRHELTGVGVPMNDAICVSPHSLEVYDKIVLDLSNVCGPMKKRFCGKASGEIQDDFISILKLAVKAEPKLKGKVGPDCVVDGECLEREPCKPSMRIKPPVVNKIA